MATTARKHTKTIQKDFNRFEENLFFDHFDEKCSKKVCD